LFKIVCTALEYLNDRKHHTTGFRARADITNDYVTNDRCGLFSLLIFFFTRDDWNVIVVGPLHVGGDLLTAIYRVYNAYRLYICAFFFRLSYAIRRQRTSFDYRSADPPPRINCSDDLNVEKDFVDFPSYSIYFGFLLNTFWLSNLYSNILLYFIRLHRTRVYVAYITVRPRQQWNDPRRHI